MELQIQFVCPECHTMLRLNFFDLAPGPKHRCRACNTPLRLTAESLERFRKDVRSYCEN